VRERERYAAYTANEAFYQGEPSAQLTTLSGVKRDEVRAVFNYARDILNKHAAATVAGLTCEVLPGSMPGSMPGTSDENHASRQRAQAQLALERALRNSSSFSTDFTAALHAAILGDGAFYASHVEGEVFYRALHPGDVDVLAWRPDGLRPARVMVQHDDRIETWTRDLVQIESNDAPGESSKIQNPKSQIPRDCQVFANPYGLIPIVLWPNWPRPGSRWGDSTLEHIKAACRLLNERLDLLMWLIRVQGNPPVKALGVDKATLRTDPGELWTGPADAQIDLVKLLDAETAGIHNQTIQLLLHIVKELSNTPDVAYGIANTQLSGRALELAYMPMTQAAHIRRGFLGDAIQRRNRILLRMSEVLHGLDLGGHYDTRVTFSDFRF
jgi:hypothetical protein